MQESSLIIAYSHSIYFTRAEIEVWEEILEYIN